MYSTTLLKILDPKIVFGKMFQSQESGLEVGQDNVSYTYMVNT